MTTIADDLAGILARFPVREETAEERVEREELERRDAELAALRDRLGRCAALQARGVPAKDIEAITDGALAETDALRAAQAFAAAGQRLLVLSGPRGCGKTTAAAWLVGQELPPPADFAAELAALPPSAADERRGGWLRSFGKGKVRAGHPMFLDVSALVRMSRYSDDEMRPLEDALLLVLDDLGMEFADEKGSFLATLDALLNARYAARLYTVITTNLPAKAFKARYGERIADRIREAGRFVELDAASLRGRR